MVYRIGLPFWRQFVKAGVPMKLRIDVLRDDEVNVFVATSNDLKGLVAEAETMDELIKEVDSSISELLIERHVRCSTHPMIDLRLKRT